MTTSGRYTCTSCLLAIFLMSGKLARTSRKSCSIVLGNQAFAPTLLNATFVIEQGANFISELYPYTRLNCSAHLLNKVLQNTLSEEVIKGIGRVNRPKNRICNFGAEKSSAFGGTTLWKCDTKRPLKTVYMPRQSVPRALAFKNGGHISDIGSEDGMFSGFSQFAALFHFF